MPALGTTAPIWPVSCEGSRTRLAAKSCNASDTGNLRAGTLGLTRPHNVKLASAGSDKLEERDATRRRWSERQGSRHERFVSASEPHNVTNASRSAWIF